MDIGAISFVEALHERVADTLDACTRFGKCVAARPMVEPEGIGLGPDAAKAPAIASGVLGLLAGRERPGGGTLGAGLHQ